MPYIVAENRRVFDKPIDRLIGELRGMCSEDHPGDINYCLSRIIWRLWQSSPDYTTGNSLVGVLECVKQEFYRRMLVPYEDEKRALNGDIV